METEIAQLGGHSLDLGNLESVIEPNLAGGAAVTQTRRWVYNPNVQLTSVRHPGSSTVANPSTRHAYNADASILWTKDAKDHNGNTTPMPVVGGGTATLGYDIDNRVVSWNKAGVGTGYYEYLPDNKRVWKKTPAGAETVFFYGVGGQKLVTYTVQGSPFALVKVTENVYFGGKLIRGEGAAVVQDRLGSVVWREGVGGRDYFPYGDEMGTASAGNVGKFGTYLRDQTTGLDYADQRYFAGLSGRFLSSDPYEASGGASNPASWGRYAYAGGDPVNANDPSGLMNCWVGGWWNDSSEPGWKGHITCLGDDGRYIGEYDRGASGISSSEAQRLVVEIQEQWDVYYDSPGGLQAARQGLRQLSTANLSKCAGVLSDLTGRSTSEIQEAARMTAGFVYDGTTSPVAWSIREFGNAPDGVRTVQDVFTGQYPATALSSATGYALYVDPSSFQNVDFGNLLQGQSIVSLSGGLSNFGMATLLHEVLHKFDSPGRTINDPYLLNKLSEHYTSEEYQRLGTGAISAALTRLCF